MGNFAKRWEKKIGILDEVARNTRLVGLRKWAQRVLRDLRDMERQDRERDAERELILT